jgi:hypothetical protein
LEAEVFPFWEFSCVTTTVVWMVLSSFLPSSNSSYSKVRPSERFLWLSYLCISVFTLFLYFDFLGGSLLALASISVCFFSWNLSLHERDLLRRNSEGCWVGENYIYIYIYIYSTGVWTQSLYPEPLHQPPFFGDGFFWGRVLWTVCPG